MPTEEKIVRIAIDFDGTIAEATYPELGVIKPHAIDVINRLHEAGHKILVWTCRTDDHQHMVKKYLEDAGMNFHHINENDPELIELYGGDSRKLSVDIYIDDRQLGGLPDDWLVIEQLIHKHIKELL